MRSRLTSLLIASLFVLAGCKDPGASTSAGDKPASASTAATAAKKDGVTAERGPDVLDPSKATEKAPDVFKAKFTTTKGDFVIEVHRDWAPLGADRFYNLVKMGFYNETRFFRVVEGFMVQFGIHGRGDVNAKWQNATIADDPVKESNKRGYVTFAMRGLGGTRTTQIFINFVDNARLDQMGFAPFGQVVEGMDVVDKFYNGYGEGAPRGQGPDQGRMQAQGNDYLKQSFPSLDWVKTATIVPLGMQARRRTEGDRESSSVRLRANVGRDAPIRIAPVAHRAPCGVIATWQGCCGCLLQGMRINPRSCR